MPLVIDLKRFAGTEGSAASVETHNALLRSFSLRELKKISGLSSMAPIVETHLKHRLQSLWEAFCLPNLPSLNMLKETGSVISGSAALDLVLPGFQVPRDLNLYCPKGAADAVVGYLFSHKYVLQGSPVIWNAMKEARPNEYFNINNGVRSLRRLVHAEGLESITVTESASSSPILPILFFHNTFMMNYCTDKEISCLYPNLTTRSTGLINRSEDCDRLHKKEAALKWEKMGVDLAWSCDSAHRHHSYGMSTLPLPLTTAENCQRVTRTLDDPIALKMRFSSEGRVTSELKVSWNLGYVHWSTTKVEYVDTHVSIASPTSEGKYSNMRCHKRALDWRSQREMVSESDGETNVAATSFP